MYTMSSMPSRLGVLALALACAACTAAVKVRTAAEPSADLSRLHTFRVMTTPTRQGADTTSQSDPMLVNSITNRALRDDISQAFERRGYVAAGDGADFAVAYYASTRERLNVTYYDYGYPFWPRWWNRRGFGGSYYGQTADVTTYDEGTVIVDVVDPGTRELIWRGQGVAEVSSDPAKYRKELARTVTAIVDKFPRAGTAVAQVP
jgi:hypothetical protein